MLVSLFLRYAAYVTDSLSRTGRTHLSVTLLDMLRCLRILTAHRLWQEPNRVFVHGRVHTFDFDKLCAQSDTSIITDSLAIIHALIAIAYL